MKHLIFIYKLSGLLLLALFADQALQDLPTPGYVFLELYLATVIVVLARKL